MSEHNVAFIGGGNMTRAIAVGMLASGFPPERMLISEPSADQRSTLATDLPGTRISGDNAAVAAAADCLLLAVKPQVLPQVCKGLRDAVQASKPLVMSIAAGIRSSDINAWMGGGLAIVRVMPNQPALLRQGVSGVFANKLTSEDQRKFASEIMAAVGAVVQVPNESDIDAVTAISGSGPAYFLPVGLHALQGGQGIRSCRRRCANAGHPDRNRCRVGCGCFGRGDGSTNRAGSFAGWHDRRGARQSRWPKHTRYFQNGIDCRKRQGERIG